MADLYLIETLTNVAEEGAEQPDYCGVVPVVEILGPRGNTLTHAQKRFFDTHPRTMARRVVGRIGREVIEGANTTWPTSGEIPGYQQLEKPAQEYGHRSSEGDLARFLTEAEREAFMKEVNKTLAPLVKGR